MIFLNRYSERTGENISKDSDLKRILLQQIAFEQSNILPQLQHMLEKSCEFYDKSKASMNNLNDRMNKQQSKFDQLNNAPYSEEKIQELNEFSEQLKLLKEEGQNRLDKLKVSQANLSIEDREQSLIEVINTTENNVQPNTIDLQSFGIKSASPTPNGN